VVANDVTELFPDWREMIAELLRSEVEFLVVGGFAVAAHGHVRATKDIDFFVRPSGENAHRVIGALRRFGAPLHGATAEDLARPGTILQLGVPPRRIDNITAIEGLSFEEAASDHISVQLAGLRIPVIGRDALLTNKRAVGRHQDLADAEALEAISPRSENKRRRTNPKPRRKKTRRSAR
jgi:hypothetical protein